MRIWILAIGVIWGSILNAPCAELSDSFQSIKQYTNLLPEHGVIPGGGRMLDTAEHPESDLAAARGIDEDSPWVIGLNDPGETVIITSDQRVDGDIILQQQAVLEVREAELRIAGTITLLGDAQLKLTSATLQIEQSFAYEHGIVVHEQARLEWNDSTVRTWGSASVGIAGTSTAALQNIHVETGFLTWGLYQQSQVAINDCTHIGEFLPLDQTQLGFTDTTNYLLWVSLPPGATIDTSLPDGTAISNWTLGPASPEVSGLASTVTMQNCGDVMWGLMARDSVQARFTDTDFRVAGTWFDASDPITISSLVNGAYWSDAHWEWGTYQLDLVNCNVQTWNFYAFTDSYLIFEHCIVGEILSTGNARVDFVNSLCDGSGGYLGVEDQATMFLVLSTNLSQMTTKGNAMLFGLHSNFGSHQIHASDSSLMFFANSHYKGTPQLHDAATSFEYRIDPFEATAGDIVPVFGSARLRRGPGSPITLDHFELEYGIGSDPASWQLITSSTEEYWLDPLASWDTSGLTEGEYTLRLTLLNSLTQPGEVVVTVPVRLWPPTSASSRVNPPSWTGY